MKTKKTILNQFKKSNPLKKFFELIQGKNRVAANISPERPQKEHTNRPISDILSNIAKQNADKYNWSDVVGVLAGIIGLAAYCTSPALAKYRGTQVLLGAAWVAIGVMFLILIWELLCIGVWEKTKKLLSVLHTHYRLHWRSVLLALCALVLLSSALVCIINPPIKTGYYAGITEIYGVPTGIGALSPDELENRSVYWKVVDHRWSKCIDLTYVEPYGQLEVMRENSSAYSMDLFPAAARIVCKYSTDQEEFRAKLDEATFTAAAEAGILRMPVSLSYFSSNGKLLLQLEQTGFGRAKITAYSPDEMPQLFGSTLLRIPDGQSARNGMTSLQIETIYRFDGLPESRRIFPYVYNQYGVNGERYIYNEKGQMSTLCYLDVNGEPVCNKLGIMSIGFSYFDGNDALRSIRYFSDQSGMEKTEGFYGVFCEKFRYNNQGNLAERQELDRSESWCYDKEGVHCYRYGYEGGRLTCEEFFGRENAPVESNRFHTSTISYEWSREKKHDILSVCYSSASFTAEGESAPAQSSAEASVPMAAESAEGGLYFPTLLQTDSQVSVPDKEQDTTPIGEQNAPDTGDNLVRNYAILRYSIATNDRRVSAVRYCNRTGGSAVSEEGYAEKRLGYDDQAHIISESYYDAGGKPCLTANGYASMRRSYDKYGRIIEITYLGLDGAPTNVLAKGYASICHNYIQLAQRETIRTSYYDTQGMAVQPFSLGYAVLEQTYNESGLLVQEAYFSTDDAPAYRRDYRVAAIFYEYSDSGDLIHEYYRDAGGMPVNRSDKGYAVIHQEFDRGQLVQRSYEGYVGHSLQPVPDRTTGATVVKYRYQNGQVQWEGYYGADGEEYVLRRDTGYAACEYEYENGRLRAQHFYGTDGSPILRGDYGYAHRRNEYNELGQLITIRYADINNDPVISTYYHCAGFNYGYDDQGNRSDVCYIDLDGEPLLRSDLGYAKLKRIYRADKIAEEWYMDTDGHPVLCKDGGYAHYEDDFGANGNWTEGRYYDADGNLTLRSDRGYAVVKFTYNDDGQRISERFYGTDGKTPIISTYYHCAGFNYGYDDQGNCSDISYVGLDEELLVRSDLGYARVKKTFQDGNVVMESFFDTSGLPAPCKDGNVSYESVYENGDWVESRYYDAAGQLMRMAKGYAFIQNTYDEFGQMLSSRFYDTDEETPVISAYYHCAGFDYAYDNTGNETQVNYIGPDGNLMPGVGLGYAQVKKTYNDMGKLIREEYFDVNGAPEVYKDQGYTAYERDYTDGFWTATRYYDAQGQLTFCKNGYAVLENTYDDYGQRIQQRYYGEDGKTPVVSSEYRCAEIRYDYDERGNTDYLGYFGPDGKLMIRSDYGFAQIEKSYNNRDELEQERYLDADGKAAVYKGRGYAAFERTRENGLLKEERYLNADGEPVVRLDEGYAIVRYGHDPFGQTTTIRYYGIDGETSVINTYYHCAGVNYGYDDQGNQNDDYYIDLDGTPLIRSDVGYAQAKRVYSIGKIIRESYFDVDGNPIPSKEGGYTRVENAYDVNGNCIESRYYDASENLTLRSDHGYAIVKHNYDDEGHCISTRYYGTDGETPIISTYYYCAGFDYICDARGNKIKIQYIGLDGNLMIRSDLGYAQADRTFDEMGRLIGEAYYDVDGEPKVNNEGYASYKESYDMNGNWVESKYYDAQEKLTRRWDTGYAVIRNEYDVFNQRIAQYYYDMDGKTLIVNTERYCAGMLFSYDNKGNRTDIRYIGPNWEPMIRSDLGYAQVIKTYDDAGQLTGEAYFDVNGQPVACNDGYASYKSVYENGLWRESSYFDTESKPVLRSDTGYAVIKNTYDAHGRYGTQRYYDTDGETPIVSPKYHCTGFSYQYDERGNRTYVWYLEPDKTIAMCAGLDLLNYLIYDDYHQIVRNSYYIFEDGTAVLVPRKDLGYATIEYVYEGKNWIQTLYLDENEQPTVSQDEGYAFLTREFNDLGQLVRVSHFNETEELTECKAGYAIVEYEYDESGNESDRIYYDAFRDEIDW